MNFSYFTVFLKNRNISSKIKRSKVTDYAALTKVLYIPFKNTLVGVDETMGDSFSLKYLLTAIRMTL